MIKCHLKLKLARYLFEKCNEILLDLLIIAYRQDKGQRKMVKKICPTEIEENYSLQTQKHDSFVTITLVFVLIKVPITVENVSLPPVFVKIEVKFRWPLRFLTI